MNPLDYAEASVIWRDGLRTRPWKVRPDLYPALSAWVQRSEAEYERQRKEDSDSVLTEGAFEVMNRNRRMAREITSMRMRYVRRMATMPAESEGILTPEERAYLAQIIEIDNKFKEAVKI